MWSSDRCGERTALHYAVLKGSEECVRVFLETSNPELQSGHPSHPLAVSRRCVC